MLEELSAKNVIPPEELEKVPNPDPETVAETPMVTTGRTISPRPLTAAEKRAVIAMQAHLRCEDLLSGKATPGRMDRRTAEGLKIYQRLHMLADNANIDLDTRTVLLGDSREHDFRALLRALRERVVDATGLLEDGSALGVQGEVQGRVLDSPEFRPLAVPADKAPADAPPRRRRRGARRRGRRRPGAAPPAAAAGRVGQDHPRRRISIAAATQAASQALGWTSPDAVLASTLAPPAPPPERRSPRARRRARDRRRCPRPSRSGCRRCRRTTAPRWSCARRSIAARWSWRGRSSTRTDTRSGSRRSPTARR